MINGKIVVIMKYCKVLLNNELGIFGMPNLIKSFFACRLHIVLLLADRLPTLWISVFEDFVAHKCAVIKEDKPHPIFAFIDISPCLQYIEIL